jgi:hypothetical protein
MSNVIDAPTRRRHGIAPSHSHFLMVVSLSRELLGVWIVSECWYRWISDHDSFQVEAAIAKISV